MKKILLALIVILVIFSTFACGDLSEHTHNVTGELVVVQEATCAREGIAHMFCTECGEVVNTLPIPKTEEHTEEVILAVESTCTESGLTEGKKCSVCDKILIEQQQTPLKAHKEETIPPVDATCSQTGLSGGIKCSVCDTVIVEQAQTPLVAHTYDDKYDENCNNCGFVRDAECAHRETETVEGYDSTCISTGLTDGTKCKKCGEIIVSQEVIPVSSHTEVIDEAVEPTCEATGLTEGKHCGVCGAIIVEQSVLEAKGHRGYVFLWEVPATCISTGLTQGYLCGHCGKVLKEQEVIPLADHKESWWWTVDKVATTDEEGSKHTECTVCGITVRSETIGKKLQPSEGLQFEYVSYCNHGFHDFDYDYSDDELNEYIWNLESQYGPYFIYNQGCYSVVGIGECKDDCIVIPDTYMGLPVTSIADHAFEDTDIVGITFGDNLESIGNYAFAGCDMIRDTHIRIPDSVLTIGDYAFSGCGIYELTIGESVLDIGERAFDNCYYGSVLNILNPNVDVRWNSFGDAGICPFYAIYCKGLYNELTNIFGDPICNYFVNGMGHFPPYDPINIICDDYSGYCCQ